MKVLLQDGERGPSCYHNFRVCEVDHVSRNPPSTQHEIRHIYDIRGRALGTFRCHDLSSIET